MMLHNAAAAPALSPHPVLSCLCLPWCPASVGYRPACWQPCCSRFSLQCQGRRREPASAWLSASRPRAAI